MEKGYAKALVELEARGVKSSELTKHLMAHLKKTGRLKLLPQILRELQKIQARHQKEYTKLEVAHSSETANALKEIEKLGLHLTGTHVNHSLIKGWRILQKDTLIDRSAKQSLITLYTNITRK